MEGSIKEQKLRAMKSYRRAKFMYNFVLYSLTSVITCFFFSYPFWSPSITHFFASLPSIIPCFLDVKCFFFVGNLIVVILIGESRLRQSSSSELDMYDEYIARSRSQNPNMKMNELKVEEGKAEMGACRRSVVPHDQENRKGMRSCRSEVWGGSERKREKSRGRKEEELCRDVRVGMRSCKSEVWGQTEAVKREERKVTKKEEKGIKNEERKGMGSCKSEVWGETEAGKKEERKVTKNEEKGIKNEERKGMRSCKSEVWGETEAVKKEERKVTKKEEKGIKNGMRSCRSEIWDVVKTCSQETKGKMEEKKAMDEEKKVVMRSCRSAIWGESDEESTNQMGMRNSKSAVWGEREINVERPEEERPSVTPEDLDKRVEAFIARVNRQRLLEANLLGSDTIG